MTDQAFELQLQTAYDAFAAEAMVDFDPVVLAAVVSRGNRRPWMGLTDFRIERPRWLPVALASVLLVVGLVGAIAAGSMLLKLLNQYSGVLQPGPDMSMARDLPVLVATDDGMVVIAAGQPFVGTVTPSAELLDPRTGRISSFVGDLPSGIGAGLRLQDGLVFVIIFDSERGPGAAYLLDPRTMTSRSVTDATRAADQWYGSVPAMTLTQDGRVFLMPATAGTGEKAPAMLFDLTTETLTESAPITVPREHEALVTLHDGRVLIAGGTSAYGPASQSYGVDGLLNDVQLWDPVTEQFSAVGTMPSVRGNAKGFVLPDGRVLIAFAGDNTTRFGDVTLRSIPLDMFDPATGTLTALEPVHWPGPPTITQLSDGRLLLTGQRLPDDPFAGTPWAGVYDPTTGRTIEQQPSRALFPQGVQTSNGRVVLAGGFTSPPWPLGNPAVPWTEVSK